MYREEGGDTLVRLIIVGISPREEELNEEEEYLTLLTKYRFAAGITYKLSSLLVQKDLLS